MKKLLLILVVCGISTLSSAHNPNQINYVFNEHNGLHQLSIHFTPKGAIDLLISLKPELENQDVIQLSDYHDLFTAYFNETISMVIEGRRVELIFQKANLKTHDATIDFQLKGIKDNYDGFFLKVDSFTEIYRRTKNFVSIPTSTGLQQFILDKDNTTCFGNNELYAKAGITMNYNRAMVWIAMALFLIFIYWFYSFKLQS